MAMQLDSEVEIGGIAWDYPNPYLYSVSVQPGDIDGLNHANNAVYVQWCEQAAWAHSGELGLSLADYRRLDRAVAIRRSEFDYIAAAWEGEQLSIATWLTGCDGKLRLERRFQVVRASDAVTLLRGRWEVVCIEISSGRPRRMPPEFADIYGRAVIDV